ncbi:MAG: hypothetical protein UR80_C0004G0002 [Parcubacteria group bacterium GW2011_GWB1_35_5]|uniref:Uncharacterized protein n=1 Tax=Candidatus Zambryskibacteria bacterium RIFCSPLOWO2_01_FULL_35_19 TaxID=1802757 RepID=A0A1G2TVU4_9BACT|nr:MAG: hypothetical protein UR50_C0009G0002 [Parcubacteria group bacterium GW2011_GWC1_34_10]KKP81285.1 MAG: hypothetical protein UR80_C0004G0002 [Parcubacteria group bacterium GW2011_GWB1_35_5]OHA85822.1 MAG: hypothetical protein A2726_02050 [Candidatus Zambryskibacteria bacterium RIFCSPHIGHO2_01_FULL_35_32]OHB01448.1 MAG: hypothetical protein A3A90_01190 [Candidatus Zambryskibacteria bacterium RIFCSPLOWO2_01_FULL_35_19]
MSEAYERDSFFVAYIKWHYGQGLKEFFGVMGNFLWFIAHFFSFKLLLRTLFTPWKRLGENYEGGFDLGAFASSVIVNGLMRAVGFVTKIIVLSVGVISYVLVLVFAFFLFLIWILAPFILVGSVILSATFFVI